jgi:hypothetical protein
MADWRSLLPWGSPLREDLAQPQSPIAAGEPSVPDLYRQLSSGGPAPRGPAVNPLLQAAPQMTPQPVQAQPQGPTGATVLVGDSLGVGTSPFLKGIKSNAVVGRSSASGVQALQSLVQGRNVGRVLFDLGTNDASAGQLQHSISQALRLAGDATIYVPTVNGPDAAHKNALLRQLDRQGRIQLIDTTGLQTGPDGIHLTASGYRKRAALIRAALS